MDVSNRMWMVRVKGQEEGPYTEQEFQDRLRAGEIPLLAEIKSDSMTDWAPLLTVISTDESFRRPSTSPPPPPKPQKPS